jgi:hypothetical protein
MSAVSAASGGEGRAAGLPAPAEVVRVLAEGTVQEAGRLTIGIIKRCREDDLAESSAHIEALAAMWEDADIPEKRRGMAMELIVKIGGVDAADMLARKVNDGSEDIAIPAVRAAGRLLARHPARSSGGGRSSTDRAMERLAEELADLAEDANGALKAAAIGALAKAERIETVPALITVLSEADGEASRLAHKALQKISGRQLPADPDAWESWHHYSTTPPEERETEVERGERGAVLARTRPPAGDTAAGGATYAYYLAGALAVLVLGGLLALRPVLRERHSARIERQRRKVRRSN